MGTKRITDLPSATSLGADDILHIVQDGTDKQISVDNAIGKQSDLPNPQNSITENVKELDDSKVSGWGSVVSLGDIALNETVTAPSTGLIRCYINPSSTSGAVARVSTQYGGNFGACAKDGTGVFFLVPVNKGEIVRVTLISGSNSIAMIMIPFSF